jgi:hypothetical protein
VSHIGSYSESDKGHLLGREEKGPLFDQVPSGTIRGRSGSKNGLQSPARNQFIGTDARAISSSSHVLRRTSRAECLGGRTLHAGHCVLPHDVRRTTCDD